MLIQLDNRTPEVAFSTSVCIILAQDVYLELVEYVEHFKTEISGCGMVTKVVQDDKSVQYVIDEVFLPSEQKNTHASTDIECDMVHKIMTQLIKDGKDTERLKLHWHSHGSMSVFHSGTDTDNYKDLNNGDFLISLVLNKDRHILGGLHLYGQYNISVKGVPVYVYVPQRKSVKIEENIKALEEYTEKNKPVFTSYYGGFRDDFYGDTEGMRWDAGQQKWVPKVSKKMKNVALFGDTAKSTIQLRKARLKEKFNAKFEYCTYTNSTAGGKCATCEDRELCAKYWVENW